MGIRLSMDNRLARKIHHDRRPRGAGARHRQIKAYPSASRHELRMICISVGIPYSVRNASYSHVRPASECARTGMKGEMSRNATRQQDRAPEAQPPRTGPGMTIPRLTFAEQLVLWSARRLATADYGAAATESEAFACREDVRTRVAGELGVALCSTKGPGAGLEAAEALERTLDVFGFAGVRGLRMNPMCCRFVSNDERLFLSLLASCQEGDHRHAATLLSWFLPPAAMATARRTRGSGSLPRTRPAHLSHRGHGLRSAQRRRACESPRFQTTIGSSPTDCERGLMSRESRGRQSEADGDGPANAGSASLPRTRPARPSTTRCSRPPACRAPTAVSSAKRSTRCAPPKSPPCRSMPSAPSCTRGSRSRSTATKARRNGSSPSTSCRGSSTPPTGTWSSGA